MIFYHQLNLSYKKDFQNVFGKEIIKRKIEFLKNLLKIKKKYAFIHDDPKLGYIIDKKFVSSGLEIIKNDKNENIFHMGKILEKAEELHLMESLLEICLKA